MSAVNESEPIQISEHLGHKEEWEKVLTDPELEARFRALGALTREHVQVAEYPWVADPQEVNTRWQHTVEAIGMAASQHGHPLMENGGDDEDGDGMRFGWVNTEWAQKTLQRIPYRSLSAPYIEQSLLLTYSLALEQAEGPDAGRVIKFCYANSAQAASDPETAAFYTDVIDLNYMGDPTESALAGVSFEDYKAMTPEGREAFHAKVMEIFSKKFPGTRFGGFRNTPQGDSGMHDFFTAREYRERFTYGTNDRHAIEDIEDKLMAYKVAALREDNPNFGKRPAEFAALPENIKQAANGIVEYFMYMRDTYEDPLTIDGYTIHNMGIEDEIEGLIAAGILQNEKVIPTLYGADLNYEFTAPYREWLLNWHYPAGAENGVENDENLIPVLH